MQLRKHFQLTRLALAVSGLASLGAAPVLAQSGGASDTQLGQSYPQLIEQNVKSKLSFISEGDRRLGLGENGATKSNEAGLDIKPEWVWQLSPHWRSKLRLQAFAATGQVDVSDEIGGTTTDGFVAMREAWLDYNGLSDYPGESVRFGRERLKEDSGMWWDDDITLVRWIFNTSLLESTVGVAQKLAELRTDNNELQDDEQDIARFFAQTRWQWKKGHYLGFLATHGQGYGDQAEEYAGRGQTLDRSFTDSLTWASLQADRSYFDWRSHDAIQYFASVAAVTGSDTVVGPDASAANGVSARDRDVSGWAADLGARAQLLDTPRWVIGAHGAMASGGEGPGESDAFQQTSLESNRSRFTGTRSQVQRFGEAIQPEWSNLQVLTLYTALSDRDTWDANVLYHRYWLSDQNGTVQSDLVEPGFTGSSDDLGQSVDLVLAYYGDSASTSWAAVDVRLRGGVFMPGDAYGDDVDDSRHRVVVDVSKRF
ncbi:alginate export family protein [Marinobacter goseongensis]|uniref:alginate export family protein n=1 Tax=Marinobacter goseongensis TaxID=453838 RepID=UPI0020067998|nr:alginate export family protein [Marinobacter goseongensis]MCK7551372.1 alginate export family protein [Marinobacter goseongensis]